MDEKKVSIAVIGCGYWGPNLIRNFNSLENAKTDYVCDIDENKTNQIKLKYPNVKVTKDYREILADPSIDAVAIALPVLKHYQVAKDALLAGKHVLIEKPIAANSAEAEELIQIAKEKNKLLMVDHTFEYLEAIKKTKEIIDSGELGEICYIKAEWLNLGLLQQDVNVVWDLAPHIISIINLLFNAEAKNLNAKAEGFVRQEIPEIAQIQIKYNNGMSAYLTFSWLEPKKTRTMTIVGSKKLLLYDMTNNEEPIKVYDKNVEMIQDADKRQPKMNYKYGDTYSPAIKNTEALYTMTKHFAECIQYNKQPKSDGVSGLKVIRILEAIDKSINEKGREVLL